MRTRLPHTATLVVPGTKDDGRGNTIDDWSEGAVTRTDYKFWLQQESSLELAEDGRVAIAQRWQGIAVMPDVVFKGNERVEALGMSFEIYGIPEPCYTLTRYHHTELKLRRRDG